MDEGLEVYLLEADQDAGAAKEAPIIIGIDVGGTKIAGLAATVTGRILRKTREATNRTSPEMLGDQISRMARTLLAEDDWCRLCGVGIGIPGRVDLDKGTTLSPYNLGWTHPVSMRKMLEDELGVPVWMDNDLNAGAIGEWKHGVGRGCSSFCYVAIGTGVALGLILEARLYRGAHYLAGEIGHTVVDPSGPRCRCGMRGCLEMLASGPAILRRYKEAAAELGGEMPVEATSAADVFLAARQGDEKAARVVDETAGFLAIGLRNVVALFDPQVVAIGGGVAQAGDGLFMPLQKHLRAWNLDEVGSRVHILPSALGADSGVVGAWLMAHMHYTGTPV